MESDKRRRIMRAAEALFRARQFHEITLDEVARGADVGKGTIYLYFSDKEDLFFQTAVAGYDDMCALLAHGTGRAADFRHELLHTCETISDFFRQRRPLFRLILAEGDRALRRGGGLRQRWTERRKGLTAAVAAMIERGVRAGDVRGDISPEVLAEYLLGMLRTRALELEDAPKPLRGHDVLVDLFTRGAGATAAGGRSARGRTRRHPAPKPKSK